MNWHERIKAAEERGGSTLEDIYSAQAWPRRGYDKPEIINLKSRFASAIAFNDFDKAECLLGEIEEIIAAM